MSDVEMRKIISFKEKYQNKWVATVKNSDKVLAASKSLKVLATKLQKSKQDYVLEWVFPPDVAFAPLVHVAS